MFKYVLSAVIAATVGTLGIIGGAAAEDFPTKPVTWVVPYTPGGITDTRARLIGAEFGKALGQTVLVENKPGAGGTIGVEYVSRAAPDGYTIIYGSLGTFAAAPTLYKSLRYDSIKDFEPIHTMAQTANTLIAYKDKPYKTVQELVDYAKAHPGEVTVGLAGIGTGTHLASELFANVTGIKLLQVPYQGSAPMLNDLIAGRLDVAFDYPVSSVGHVKSGSVRVLALTGLSRNPLFPEVPTMKEAGFEGATTGSWSGIFAPAGTPKATIKKLTDAFDTAMKSDAVVTALKRVASDFIDMDGEEMGKFVSTERVRWNKIIESAGIKKR